MTTKKCRQCGKVKPLSEYTRNTPESTTVKTKCKECLAAVATAVRRARNPQFVFDEVLTQWIRKHARRPKRHTSETRVKGYMTTVALEHREGDEYTITSKGEMSKLTRVLFGHPTGVAYG